MFLNLISTIFSIQKVTVFDALLLYCIFSRDGHAQLFFESAIAIPPLEGSTSAIAIPQLLKKCCYATSTPQFCNRNFFLMSATSSLQVENFISAIFGIFLAMESGRSS